MNNDDTNNIDPDDDCFPWPDVVACRKNYKDFDGKKDPASLKPLTKNCPHCGGAVERFYFESPPFTWNDHCGRAGWMEACFACKRQISFELGLMS